MVQSGNLPRRARVQQEYERGVPAAPVRRMGATTKRGTKTTFKPDPQIFEHDEVSVRRAHQAAARAGVPQQRRADLAFNDERTGEAEEFYYERGIVEFIEHLNRTSEPDSRRRDLSSRGESDGVGYEIALQYASEYTENLHFLREQHQHARRRHARFRFPLRAHADAERLRQEGEPVQGSRAHRRGFSRGAHDRHLGASAEPQVRRCKPKRSWATPKWKASSTGAFGEFLGKYPRRKSQNGQDHLRQRQCSPPKLAKRPARRASSCATARMRLAGAGCRASCAIASPAKWRRCELYLVEGDSAGGSAEGGRLREFQAILPLRGKIINAYKSREDKVLANEEVQSMIQAIGAGIGPEQDITRLPLQQDDHHDRCRRRRLAHPHAAALLFLPANVSPHRRAGTCMSPSRRCSACDQEGNVLRANGRGDEERNSRARAWPTPSSIRATAACSRARR